MAAVLRCVPPATSPTHLGGHVGVVWWEEHVKHKACKTAAVRQVAQQTGQAQPNAELLYATSLQGPLGRH
jgi:hypothetical protein